MIIRNAGTESIASTRSRFLRHTEKHSVIFSVKQQQHEHAGSSRQDRDRDAESRVVESAGGRFVTLLQTDHLAPWPQCHPTNRALIAERFSAINLRIVRKLCGA